MTRCFQWGLYLIIVNKMKINEENLIFNLKIIREIFGDFFYFPIWWYTSGFANQTKRSLLFLENRSKGLSFFIWIKNIFVPMYGQSDWQGKLISFVFRIINIIIRGAIMLFWLLIALFFEVFWIVLPPYVLYKIFI